MFGATGTFFDKLLFMTRNQIPVDNIAEFEWDSKVQSYIQSSFYWMYVMSQVVGG